MSFGKLQWPDRDAIHYFFLAPVCIAFAMGYFEAFGTGELLSGYETLAYWLPIMFLAWFQVYVVTRWVACTFRRWKPPLSLCLVLGCALASVAVAAEIYWYESAYFPQLLALAQDYLVTGSEVSPGWVEDIVGYYFLTLPAMLLIAGPINLLWRRDSRFVRAIGTDGPPHETRARLPAVDFADAPLDSYNGQGPRVSSLHGRLPKDLGTEILCLIAQQHYLKVVTRRGSALVLYRLSDAERDLQATDGLRVHRSYWVSRSAVDRLERKDGRLFIHLVTGERIPVSRTYSLAVKEAGWQDEY